MAATTLRSDIRTEVRDLIQETSGVQNAIWSDALLNRHITRELRALPSQNIYLEETWEQSLTGGTDYSDGLALPSGTEKVESVERNDGSATTPNWNTISGVDFYQGAIFFPYTIPTDLSIRVKIKKQFTVPSDDVTALDLPDDKCEILVWGVVIRCYRILMGYLRNSVSWDAVTKPGDLQMTVIQNWLRDAQEQYKMLIKQYQTDPKPRDIDLVN